MNMQADSKAAYTEMFRRKFRYFLHITNTVFVFLVVRYSPSFLPSASLS